MTFNRRRRTGRGFATVELTPLIDVVFLLLIFFMVSTTFTRESVLEVDLPDTVSAVPIGAAGDIEVRVDAAGGYAVDTRVLPGGDAVTLQGALREARDGFGRPNPRVVVAADADARHEAVVVVLDAARQLGLTQVRILTEARHPATHAEVDHGD